MLSRIALALAAVAALAVPASASAERGPGRLPVCSADAVQPAGEGTTPTCAVRVCADGQASTADVPCLARCPAGVRPTREAPCAPVPAAQQGGEPTSGGDDSTPAGDTPAHGKRDGQGGGKGNGNGFGKLRNQVWRVSGEADGFDTDRHALSIVVDQVKGLSPRLAARLQDVLGDQADVLVSARTRVIDADGNRLSGDAAAAALDAADSVQVTARLAPRSAWAEDGDGTPVPAMRALRIKITG
jgi:hypothetical protein